MNSVWSNSIHMSMNWPPVSPLVDGLRMPSFFSNFLANMDDQLQRSLGEKLPRQWHALEKCESGCVDYLLLSISKLNSVLTFSIRISNFYGLFYIDVTTSSLSIVIRKRSFFNVCKLDWLFLDSPYTTQHPFCLFMHMAGKKPGDYRSQLECWGTLCSQTVR